MKLGLRQKKREPIQEGKIRKGGINTPQCNVNIPMSKIQINMEYKVISESSVYAFNSILEQHTMQGWQISREQKIKLPMDNKIYCMLERGMK